VRCQDPGEGLRKDGKDVVEGVEARPLRLGVVPVEREGEAYRLPADDTVWLHVAVSFEVRVSKDLETSPKKDRYFALTRAFRDA
jgi:hypothetical protein